MFQLCNVFKRCKPSCFNRLRPRMHSNTEWRPTFALALSSAHESQVSGEGKVVQRSRGDGSACADLQRVSDDGKWSAALRRSQRGTSLRPRPAEMPQPFHRRRRTAPRVAGDSPSTQCPRRGDALRQSKRRTESTVLLC